MILFAGATTEDATVVKQLLSSVGLCEQVPEYQQVNDKFLSLPSGPVLFIATGHSGSSRKHPYYCSEIIDILKNC